MSSPSGSSVRRAITYYSPTEDRERDQDYQDRKAGILAIISAVYLVFLG